MTPDLQSSLYLRNKAVMTRMRSHAYEKNVAKLRKQQQAKLDQHEAWLSKAFAPVYDQVCAFVTLLSSLLRLNGGVKRRQRVFETDDDLKKKNSNNVGTLRRNHHGGKSRMLR